MYDLKLMNGETVVTSELISRDDESENVLFNGVRVGDVVAPLLLRAVNVTVLWIEIVVCICVVEAWSNLIASPAIVSFHDFDSQISTSPSLFL